MKLKLLLLAALSGLFLSCSSDSDDNSDNTPVNFNIPLADNKYWTYDVYLDDNYISRDSLYIAGDSLINGIAYKRFETKDNIATGFYSSALRNNGVREFNNKLLLSGDLSLAGGMQLPIGLDLVLDDFIIFKKSARVNESLSSKSGSFQQDFNGFPLTISYTLKSKGGETIASYTSPNNDTYTNVKTSKIVLSVTVTTVIPGSSFSIPVLDTQDVLVSTQYIADNIGVVYVNTVTSYTMNSLAAGQLDVPASGSQTQEEFLQSHN